MLKHGKIQWSDSDLLRSHKKHNIVYADGALLLRGYIGIDRVCSIDRVCWYTFSIIVERVMGAAC